MKRTEKGIVQEEISIIIVIYLYANMSYEYFFILLKISEKEVLHSLFICPIQNIKLIY